MKPKNNIKLLEAKSVKVGEQKYPVKLTFRAMIDFETMTGKSIALATSTEDVSKLIYVAAKAGAKAFNNPFQYTYEEFLDVIDEHPEALIDFYEALAEGEPAGKK